MLVKIQLLKATVMLAKDVIIKQNCRLFPSVKILSLCLIEDRVVINSGVVVGSDGYGFDLSGCRGAQKDSTFGESNNRK